MLLWLAAAAAAAVLLLLLLNIHSLAQASKKAGKSSTVGLGTTAPLEAGSRAIDGAKWPTGVGAPNAYLEENLARLCAAEKAKKPALLYNEYIVYELEQVRIRYVVVCDAHFV